MVGRHCKGYPAYLIHVHAEINAIGQMDGYGFVPCIHAEES